MRSPPTCSPLPLLDVAVSALLLPRALHTSAHTRLASYPQSLLLTPAFSRIASHIHSARKGAVHLHQADPSILSFYSPSLQLLMLVMKLSASATHPSTTIPHLSPLHPWASHLHISTSLPLHTHTHTSLCSVTLFFQSLPAPVVLGPSGPGPKPGKTIHFRAPPPE